MLARKTNQHSFIGRGLYALNYIFIKKTLSTLNLIVGMGKVQITNQVQFYDLPPIYKLNKLGFNFTHLIFKNKLPIISYKHSSGDRDPVTFKAYLVPSNVSYMQVLFKLTLLKLVSLRSVHISMALYLSGKVVVNG